MKRPTNFEIIKNRIFKHNGLEYRLKIRKEELGSTTQMWLLPLDKCSNAFTHVMLFTIVWNKGMTLFEFPKKGWGVRYCLPTDSSHRVPLTNSDIASPNHFIQWCQLHIDKFSKLIKK